MSDDDSIMDRGVALSIAQRIVAGRLERRWSREAICASVEGGPTACGRGFYLMRRGGIAVAEFAMTQLQDMNGRGYLWAISEFLPALPGASTNAQEDIDQEPPFTRAPARGNVRQLELFA